MKICFFNINAYGLFSKNPENYATGGTEIQLFLIAKELSKDEDIKVSFIVGDFGQTSLYHAEKIDIYKTFSTKKSILNYVLAPFKLWESLRNVNADVYIASSAGIEIGIIAFFCKIFKKRFIFRTASSVDCNLEKIKQLGIIGGNFYKYGLENASSVVVQNMQDSQNLLRFHKKFSKIIKNSFKITTTKEPAKEYILWVGSARKVKRPEVFFEIAKNFPNEHFVMILSKSADIRLRNILLRESLMIANLKLIPGIPFSESQDYFNKAKLLIGTSLYEGFPNVYIQACIAGVPIVSLFVNPDSFITANNIGYVSNNSLDVLIGQITNLLADNNDYTQKSTNAYQYALTNHSIEENVKIWKEVISSVSHKKY